MHKNRLMLAGASLGVLGWLIFSESSFASNISEPLNQIQATSSGPLLKAGLTLGTVVGTVTAAFKHSIGLAVMVMGVGVLLSFYMSWLNTHNFGG